MSAFSRALGVSFKSLQDWTRGEALPSLAAMIEIERLTKGVIPIEMWAGTTRVKSQIATMRSQQPAEIQRMTLVAPVKTQRQLHVEATVQRQIEKSNARQAKIDEQLREQEELSRLKEEFEGPAVPFDTATFATQLAQEIGLDADPEE